MTLALGVLGGWFMLAGFAGMCWSVYRGRQKRIARDALEMAWAQAGRRTIETEYRRVQA